MKDNTDCLAVQNSLAASVWCRCGLWLPSFHVVVLGALGNAEENGASGKQDHSATFIEHQHASQRGYVTVSGFRGAQLCHQRW